MFLYFYCFFTVVIYTAVHIFFIVFFYFVNLSRIILVPNFMQLKNSMTIYFPQALQNIISAHSSPSKK